MKYNKLTLIASASILVFCLLLLSFEKFHLINLYSKPRIAKDSRDPRPINTVDYTPQTSPPDPTINSEKNPASSNVQNPVLSNVAVSITRANQDLVSKNLNIGVLVDGTKTGTCKLDLLQNNIVMLTKNADVTEQSSLVTCAGFSVLNSEIPAAGTYTIKISVGSATASLTKELTK